MLPKWTDEICFEMPKLASFTPNFECVTVLSPLLGKGKDFPFLYFTRIVVIPLDYTGNRNFYRHSSVVVFATTFIQPLSKCLPGFLLLHNQLSIINSNQWTFRRIGEWLSIFIDWLSQSILIDRLFYRFLLIISIEINVWFSLIVFVWITVSMYLCRRIQTSLFAPYHSQANWIYKATANKIVELNMSLVYSYHAFVDTITKGHWHLYETGFARTS